jgi:hypothetical protein
LRRGETLKAIKDFSTPNAENCRNLLLRVGFDPWEVWKVADGRSMLSRPQTRARLDEWLQVRHALVHGDALPAVDVLDRSTAGTPMVTRRAAERCLRFVRGLIEQTESSLHP